jgi:integrase
MPAKKTRRPLKKTRGQIIHKGSDKWQVRAFAGRDARGSKRYVARTITGPYSEAQKALTALHTEIDRGTFIPKSHETLDEYARAYFAGREIEPATRRTYLQRLDNQISPRFGDRKLQTLTRVELQEFFQDLKKPPHSLGDRSRQMAYQTLKMVLEQARKDGLITTNPMADVTRPRMKQSSKVYKIQPLDDEQTARLLQANEGEPYGTLWLFLLTTGARPGEALALEWQHVFLDDPVPHVMIEQALSEDEHGRADIRSTKTEGSKRRVTIPERLVRALREHRTNQLKYNMRRGHRSSLVFPSPTGRLYRQRNVLSRWKTACKRAKVPQVRLYDARHTHATWLLNNGVNPKVAAERLGHSSTKMFLDVYTHVTKQEEDKALAVLNSAWG